MTALMEPVAITTPARRIPLIDSTRAELRRLLRWPVTWVLAVVWALLNVLFGYVFNWISYRTGDASGPVDPGSAADFLVPQAVPHVLVQGMPIFGGAIVLILGGLAVGSGYGWGTWKTVYTQGPSRTAAFGGTLAALLVLTIGLVLAMVGIDLAMSSLIVAIEGLPSALPGFGELARSYGGGVLIMSMWAAVGVLLGVLARSPALATGLGLVWSLVVENLLRGVANALPAIEGVTYRLPGSATGSLAGALGAQTAGDGGAPGVLDKLSGPVSVAWVAGYLAACVAVSLVLVRRRDLL
jgi:ABC-2 type transport system permease protein